jgi:hypothetical protein
MRLLAGLGVPCLIFAGIEGMLRLAGYGYPSSFFLKPSRTDTSRAIHENPRFGWRFFPPPLARTPQPVNLQLQKASNTCRIFVLGESAVMGDPEPAYGLAQILRLLLQARFPEQKFEIVNTAMTAINSHVILPIARECARQDGDIWTLNRATTGAVGRFGGGPVLGNHPLLCP